MGCVGGSTDWLWHVWKCSPNRLLLGDNNGLNRPGSSTAQVVQMTALQTVIGGFTSVALGGFVPGHLIKTKSSNHTSRPKFVLSSLPNCGKSACRDAGKCRLVSAVLAEPKVTSESDTSRGLFSARSYFLSLLDDHPTNAADQINSNQPQRVYHT